MQEQNAGREPPRRLRISAHDYFKATNRGTNGKSYDLLKKALDRLRGCSIKTNIKTNKTEITSNFGLIERVDIIESHRVKDRLIRFEILLSEWYYNAILGKSMLTINEDYFLLKKGFERRLYEIARKHCGQQNSFQIRLENLHEKTGSTGVLKRFRFNLKKSIQDNDIPDYQYSLDDNELVTIKNACKTPTRDKKKLIGGKASGKPSSTIKAYTMVKAKKLHADSYTDWEFSEILEQFDHHNDGKKLDSVDGSFIGFVKQKIETYRKDYA
jgi:hypothetical protein